VPGTTGLGYVPGDWNATFVGFVPAQHPQLSGIVVLNHPTPIYGGLVSAPVFSQIMRYALRRFDIPPPSSAALAATVARASKR
jgi:cell division protein FtsI/penicillin-binding protein 2